MRKFLLPEKLEAFQEVFVVHEGFVVYPEHFAFLSEIENRLKSAHLTTALFNHFLLEIVLDVPVQREGPFSYRPCLLPRFQSQRDVVNLAIRWLSNFFFHFSLRRIQVQLQGLELRFLKMHRRSPIKPKVSKINESRAIITIGLLRPDHTDIG